ncbi:Poly [ADP-ribose] polymerase 11 [Nibea albiflora]|uniref:Poly [ADP-ribose] polymerase 11 n=1 Tax=Nibea albiflora TaxID=240163 RepID=A0ACB7EV59_NIBAL|nr:Poly [ADP-ribose] polymerase 11 [Nibea albiflora]
MDTSDTPWHWHYLADCGRWHRFEDEPDDPLRSEDIEFYYQINSKAVIRVPSSCDRHSYIDFSAMLQTDLGTGKQRRIQRGFDNGRSCSCFSVAPVFWENVHPTYPYQFNDYLYARISKHINLIFSQDIRHKPCASTHSHIRTLQAYSMEQLEEIFHLVMGLLDFLPYCVVLVVYFNMQTQVLLSLSEVCRI